jgi:amidase
VNVLDYCSVVIPVTTADKELDVRTAITNQSQIETGIHGQLVSDTASDCRHVLIDLTDDAEIFHGTPVGVQIVGRKLEEEKILAVAQRVVDALHRHKASKMASEAKSGKYKVMMI